MINSESDFFNYARKYYDNPSCKTAEEFTEDVNRFKYLKKAVQRYLDGDEIDERLIINHIMILYNVFERRACTNMLFYRMDEEHYPVIKTVLTYLNQMPDSLPDVGVIGSNIKLHEKMVAYLRKL